MRYRTLLLDQTAWDLVLDSHGNIAVADPPYAQAQDVASAVRLFKGELWYNTEKGVPYFTEILGQSPPISLIKQLIERAALTVPGVVSARCELTSNDNREIFGQIDFIDEVGVANNVSF
jgi:hypothetical protein